MNTRANKHFVCASLLVPSTIDIPFKERRDLEPWETPRLSVPHSIGFEYLQVTDFGKFRSPLIPINNFWKVERFFMGWERTTKTLVCSSSWTLRGESWYHHTDFLLIDRKGRIEKSEFF